VGRLTFTNDQAYELIIDFASGRVHDITAIAAALRANTERRPTA
jgi:hypothetical protein